MRAVSRFFQVPPDRDRPVAGQQVSASRNRVANHSNYSYISFPCMDLLHKKVRLAIFISMAVPHSQYRQPGEVVINPTTCKHCGLCARICPADVLELRDSRIHVRSDSFFGCIACGHCMMVCPEDSIRIQGRGMHPGDLVGLPAKEKLADAKSLEALMLSRRSVRRFTSQEVPRELLERIVQMAATAPMGIPPWDVGCGIIHGSAEVKAIADEVVQGYEQLLKILKPWMLSLFRPFIRRNTYEMFKDFILPLGRSYIEAAHNGKDRLFWGAPAVLIFHHSPYADSSDAMIACTYAMLAAESLGLGSTMIGGAPPIIQRNKKLSLRLGIPQGNKASIALILGYPATQFRRAIRRRFSSVHFNA